MSGESSGESEKVSSERNFVTDRIVRSFVSENMKTNVFIVTFRVHRVAQRKIFVRKYVDGFRCSLTQCSTVRL